MGQNAQPDVAQTDVAQPTGGMMTDAQLDNLLAKAVQAGAALGQERESIADGRGILDRPEVKQAIADEVTVRVTEEIGKAKADFQDKLDRAFAERSAAIVGQSAKTALDMFDGCHLRKHVARKGTGRFAPDGLVASDVEKDAQIIADDLLVIGRWAKDPNKAAALYLRERGLENTEFAKALDTYTSTGGTEWVPTIATGNFIADIDAQTTVAPLFPRVTMTAKSITLPGGAGIPVVYKTTGGENAAVTESTTPTTRNVTLTAGDLKAHRGYSDQLDEDSIVSAAAYLRSRLAYGIAYNLDRAILDGDTSGTHMDTGAVGATDPRKCWIGLRKKALTNTGANKDLGTFNADNLLGIPAAMGAYAEDPSKLVWIVPGKVYWGNLILLKDSSNNPVWQSVLTGNAAPIVSGQVGWIGGAPVVQSGVIRTDLNASGVYDGITTDNTVLHMVHRDAWLFGTRREVTIETDKDILKGEFDLVITWRGDFGHLQGTALTTALGYNIA